MSPRTLLALLFLTPHAASAAPNETCAEALPLVRDVPTLGSTLAVETAQEPSPCGVDDEHALWFSFTAPTTDPYVFQTFGSAIDTTLAVFSACDGELLACNDDALQSLQSELDLYLDEGRTYWIRVGGWGATQGDVAVRVDTVWQRSHPANDHCEDAVALTFGRGTAADTYGATGVDLSSCGPMDGVDVWYTFVAPSAGRYDFTITQGILSQHFISLHESCDGSGELACGFAGASADLMQDQLVYVRVGSYGAVSDQFNVNVGPVEYPVPPNDTHLGAIEVGFPSTTFGTTRGAEPEAMNYGPVCGAYVTAAVWYKFIAPSDGTYVFDTNGSTMEDTIIAVLAPCAEQGEVVPHLYECNNDDGIGLHGRLEGFIKGGDEVCLVVAGRYLSEEGDFRLNISAPLPPPLNDECGKATRVEIGETVTGQNYSARPVVPVGGCPLGEFALWYTFTAPADGAYKFDVKASDESSPDIAVYDDCDTTVPIVCDYSPWPALHVDMVAGQTVRVRVATDVWWRSVMALRVTPVREAEEPDADEDPVVELVEPAPEPEPEPDASEPDDAEPDDAEPDVSEPEPEPEPGPEPDASEPEPQAEVDPHNAVEGGCGCSGGASPLPMFVVLAWLWRRRTI